MHTKHHVAPSLTARLAPFIMTVRFLMIVNFDLILLSDWVDWSEFLILESSVLYVIS